MEITKERYVSVIVPWRFIYWKNAFLFYYNLIKIYNGKSLKKFFFYIHYVNIKSDISNPLSISSIQTYKSYGLNSTYYYYNS